MLQQAIFKQANFVESLAFNDLSVSSIHACKRIVLDSVAAMAAGAVQTAQSLPEKIHGGGCTVIGRRGSCSPEWAAFLNGCHMVATEMDEGNQFAKGHPMSHLFPALLAEAESGEFSGRDFIEAIIPAYEIGSRWGRSVTLRPEVHPHGNWGTAAAACAVAKIRKCSAEEIGKAILLAGSIPLPTAWASAFSGVNVRDAYIGLSNMHGLMVPEMMAAGIISSPQVVSSMYNKILGKNLDIDSLSEGLGHEFLIEKNYFKPHASCRFTHGVIESLEKIQLKKDYSGIREICVETYGAAAALDKKNPATILAAKFSIPYVAALQIVKGGVTQDDFTLERLNDSELCRLADKVTVKEDPALSALLPDKRATRVTVSFEDGSTAEAMVDMLKGDYADPLSDTEVEEKFHLLCRDIWPAEQRNKIVQAISDLENITNIKTLFSLLRIKNE